MKSREELISIFEDTKTSIIAGGYKDPTGHWHEIPDPVASIFYSTVSKLSKDDCPVFPETIIKVVNEDTFNVAEKLPGCAVLNMASFSFPGGGVTNGARAQEEELCRRSNLTKSLYAFDHRMADVYGPPYGNSSYPIPMFGGIYSTGITVFKSAVSYNGLINPFQCDVITVPGLKKPVLDRKTGELQPKDVIALKGKIRAIFRMAILGKNESLVLGALGCGAYGNPPSHVARLFKEVLGEDEFIHSFSKIYFAILEDTNSRKNIEGGNLKPFKKVFENGN